jgi:hypothetical protein
MANHANTHATHYRAHRKRRQVPTEEGGQPRPPSLPGCPAKPTTSSPAQIRATREERGGRWVGGNCRGPMASQTATRALPPLPPSTRPSDVHCDASAIHMHIRCARAPPPAAAPTTSHCRPVGSTHDGRGFVAGTMDFTAVRENRGEGRGLPRPHDLSGCHPHPATSTPPPPSRPRASPLASWTPRSQPPLNHQRGVGGVIASVLQRLPHRLHHPCGWPPHRRRSCRAQPLPRVAATTARRLGEQPRPLSLPGYPSIHCHRLCQPRAIERTIRTGSDCLRYEEGGRGKLPRPPRPPRHSVSPPTVSTARVQPPSSNPAASSRIRSPDVTTRRQPPR